MNFKEIKKMAKGMGVNTFEMKKTEMIRSIQRAENNSECYGTEKLENCNEDKCLWRADCRSFKKSNNKIDSFCMGHQGLMVYQMR